MCRETNTIKSSSSFSVVASFARVVQIYIAYDLLHWIQIAMQIGIAIGIVIGIRKEFHCHLIFKRVSPDGVADNAAASMKSFSFAGSLIECLNPGLGFWLIVDSFGLLIVDSFFPMEGESVARG